MTLGSRRTIEASSAKERHWGPSISIEVKSCRLCSITEFIGVLIPREISPIAAYKRHADSQMDGHGDFVRDCSRSIKNRAPGVGASSSLDGTSPNSTARRPRALVALI